MEDQDRQTPEPDEEREYKLPPDVEAHGKQPPMTEEGSSEPGDDDPDVEAHKTMI